MERGMTDEANIQAAFDHLASRAQAGDAEATELGMTAHGDLWMYWHIRGKHLSARKYARSFLEISKEPTRGRARLLITAGLASWTLRNNQQALEEWSEAYRIAEDLGDRRTMANATVGLAVGHIGIDLDKALHWAAEGIELGRELDYPFILSLILSFDGILHAISGDAETAKARYEEALSIQDSRGDHQGGGLSLGGLAQLAAMGGDIKESLELYERSRAAFEALGDRAEEARVLGEMAWTYLAHGDSERARHTFLDSAQAYEDVGSVPGVGTSMIGLAAVDAVEGQPKRAVTIACAAERFSEEEGIVNVYSEDSPGRPYLEAAKAELSAEVIAAAEKDGRGLTVRETMRMVRG
jgi:tetratricopeptide (TPR) repeat protein